MTQDVYICYHDSDKHLAENVCSALETNGLRCWYAARDIRKEEDAATAKINAMDNSGLCVVVFSSAANKNHITVNEICYAADRKIPIVVLQLCNDKPVDSLKYFLASAKWVKYSAARHAGSLKKLAFICNEQLNRISASAVHRKSNGVKLKVIVPVLAVMLVAGIGIGVICEKPSDEEAGEELSGSSLTCVLGEITYGEFTEAYNKQLSNMGVSDMNAVIYCYDRDGNIISSNEKPVYSLELQVPGGNDYESVRLTTAALLMTIYRESSNTTGDYADEIAATSEDLLQTYGDSAKSITDAIGGYTLFCDIDSSGGVLTIVPQ